MQYATYVVEWDFESGSEKERLIVVDAATMEQARRETGLPDATFHEAEPLELAEWDELTGEGLGLSDLVRLERMVRGELVALHNERLRLAERHEPDSREARRGVGKAVRLAALRGRLLSWIREAEQVVEDV